jgi:hypothetical protein
MARPTFALTAAVQEEICRYLTAGAFAQVAAEAAGIPAEVFARWLEAGRRKGAREPYRTFSRRVQTAMAQARLLAESAVLEKAPHVWLKSGPGRETPDKPGWTRDVSALTPPGAAADPPLASPEWAALWEKVEHALADFPDARLALSRAFGEPHEPESAEARKDVRDSPR